MVLLYMVTFTINIPQMLAYIAYMDPMGYYGCIYTSFSDTSMIHYHSMFIGEIWI